MPASVSSHEAKKIAIVGSGCSGIGALWALKSTQHEVHLFEAQDRLGGHTNTVDFQYAGMKTKVDTGFIVLNTATYPNFIAFLKELRIPTVKTEMTFGVSRDQGAFEWAGTSLSAVFAQRSNLLRLGMWRMIFDIVRFNHFALDLLSDAEESEEDPSGAGEHDQAHHPPPAAGKQLSIGEYLEREGYSEEFKNDYLIPMTAAVWSTSPEKTALTFPAITLVRFMWNHHLLNTISPRAPWMTIREGSQLYIDAVLRAFPDAHIHTNHRITSLDLREDGKISLHIHGRKAQVFDHVILATHGDQALEIMQHAATPEERAILSKFRTSTNAAVLHSDLALMPRRRVAWSAWNYITTSRDDAVRTVCLTYSMNILQHIPRDRFGDVLVTLNPPAPSSSSSSSSSSPRPVPDPATVQGSWTYAHPVYDAGAITAQRRLPRIQNARGISYAGAWTKYGFHEDGFSSGLAVAMEHLGAEIPFEFVDSTFSRGRRPVLRPRDHAVRIAVQLVMIPAMLCGIVLDGIRWGSRRIKSKAKAV